VLTYQPGTDLTGRDQFTVGVCDDGLPSQCTQVTVPVTVTPLALADAAAVPAGAVVDIAVAANDQGQTGPATVTVPPQSGTAEVTGSIRYQPNPDYVGADTFTYQICSITDPDVCGSAPVHITVEPVARDDSATTNSGQPAQIAVLANDTLGPGTAITLRVEPTHGAATTAPDGTVTYTPTGLFAGTDAFTYQACAESCATAAVTVTVAPALNNNVAVTAQGQAAQISVVSNDFGAATRPVVTSAPAHGTVTGGGTGLIVAFYAGTVPAAGTLGPLVYTPHPHFVGVDTFSYTRCALTDPNVCSLADVVVFVRPASPPPLAAPGAGQPLATTGFAAPTFGLAALAILSGAALRLLARRRSSRSRHSTSPRRG
jgi:hypothetical protein